MVKINLSGPQGNAFYIMGEVDMALKENGCTKEQRDAYQDSATSSDYDTLLEVTKETLNKYGIEFDIDYDTNSNTVEMQDQWYETADLEVDESGLEMEYDEDEEDEMR